jgi:hypothetical protein
MDELERQHAGEWLDTRLVCAFLSPDGRSVLLRYAKRHPQGWAWNEAETRLGVLPAADFGGGGVDALFESIPRDAGKGRHKWVKTTAGALAAYSLAARGSCGIVVLHPQRFGAIGAHWWNQGEWIDEKTPQEARLAAIGTLAALGVPDEPTVLELAQWHDEVCQSLAWRGATAHWAGLLTGAGKSQPAGILNPSIAPATIAPQPPVSQVVQVLSHGHEFRVIDGSLELVDAVKFRVEANSKHPIWRMVPLGQLYDYIGNYVPGVQKGQSYYASHVATNGNARDYDAIRRLTIQPLSTRADGDGVVTVELDGRDEDAIKFWRAVQIAGLGVRIGSWLFIKLDHPPTLLELSYSYVTKRYTLKLDTTVQAQPIQPKYQQKKIPVAAAPRNLPPVASPGRRFIDLDDE